VFQPTVNTSYYLSYANNFTTNSGIDVYGNLLPASVIDHYELGAKQTYLKGRLSTNVSVYKIINSRFAQQAQYKADGITPNNDATVKTLSGETTSDGFELGLNGNLSNHFYFITGYAYNNIRFTNTAGSKGSNIEGEQLTNAPSNTANASIFYTFNNVKLEGFKIGLCGFYTGKRYGGYNNLVGQSILGSRLIALSDYTTIDITVAYNYKKIGVNCKLSNVFNTLNYLVHDNYSINPIAPRQFYTTLNYRF
jgi:iron complex outermembrane receptor protein